MEESEQQQQQQEQEQEDAAVMEDSWKDSDFLSFDAPITNNSDNNDGRSNKKRKKNEDEDDHSDNSNSNDNNATHWDLAAATSTSTSATLTSTSITNLPPWMDKPHIYKHHPTTPKLILLHDEIVNFVNLMSPQPDELEKRNVLIHKVKKLIMDLFQKKINNGNDNNSNNKNGNGNGKEASSSSSSSSSSSTCEVHVFGSQTTGLLLPTSDIDFVVLLPDYDENNNNTTTTTTDSKTNANSNGNANGNANANTTNKKNNNKNETNTKHNSTTPTPTPTPVPTAKQQEQKEMDEYNIHNPTNSNASPLQQIANEIQKQWGGSKNELSYLEVVENTKVPIVKFTHKLTNISADICINESNGIQAATLMKRFLESMPPLKPLTFLLKYFMAVRGLNEPYTGGCGSFMIQMMIVSFLQHRERWYYNHVREYNAPMNLGSLLLDFFELYGMDFNYLTTGISVRNDGFYFPKGNKGRREYFFTNPSRAFTLGIENPFDITMDIGKSSFRMQLIQKSFEVALRVLLSHVAYPAVETQSILASILPPTEEMYKRATLHKVLKIEMSLKSQGYDPQTPSNSNHDDNNENDCNHDNDSNHDSNNNHQSRHHEKNNHDDYYDNHRRGRGGGSGGNRNNQGNYRR